MAPPTLMSWATLTDMAIKSAIQPFKTAAVYTRVADPTHPIPVDGVLDRPHLAVDPQTGAQVQTVNTTFGIRKADLPADPAEGDSIVIGGITYYVMESVEDGETGTSLVLQKVG